MTTSIQYFGIANYDEYPVTGVRRVWTTGQKQDVPDAVAALLVVAGKKFQLSPTSRVIVSPDAPSNSDGLPDGTIYVQSAS